MLPSRLSNNSLTQRLRRIPATGDTNSNEDPGVAAFKPSNDPATANNSATSGAGVVAPKPTDDPASTKDPGTSDPNIDYGPAIVAEPEKGPGFPNLATSGPNGGKNSDVVVPQPANHPADPSGSHSTDQQPSKPLPNTNGEPYTSPSVHAAAPVQAPFVTAVDSHDNVQVPEYLSSVVIVDSPSFTAGYTPTIVSSTYIALHTNGDIVLGNSTIHSILPTATSASVLYFTLGGETMTLSAAHLIAVGKTFAAGDQGPTIDSKVVSLGSTALAIRTPTVPLGAESSSLPSVATIAADKTVTLVPSGIIVQNANLTSNGPAVTASGALSSLGNGGLESYRDIHSTPTSARLFSFHLYHLGPDNHRPLKRHRNRRHSINSERARHHKFGNTRIGWKRRPGNCSPRELGSRSDSGPEGAHSRWPRWRIHGGAGHIIHFERDGGQYYMVGQWPDGLPWKRREGPEPGRRSTREI